MDVFAAKINKSLYKQASCACEMAQKVKAPTTKSNDLSVISKTHVVDGENRFLQTVF